MPETLKRKKMTNDLVEPCLLYDQKVIFMLHGEEEIFMTVLNNQKTLYSL